MAKKSANIMVRVEPEVKAKAEAVMSELGVPASVVVNMLYKHIIRTGGIPFPVSLTQESEPDGEVSSVVREFPVKENISDKFEITERIDSEDITGTTEDAVEGVAAKAEEASDIHITPKESADEKTIDIPGLRAPSGAKKIITILG